MLELNAASWDVLRGKRAVELLELRRRKVAKTRLEEASWEGVDEELFESLRALRREIAAERGVPAYVILDDSTLRELSRVRPKRLDDLRAVHGIGERKLADLGARLLERIERHARGADAP